MFGREVRGGLGRLQGSRVSEGSGAEHYREEWNYFYVKRRRLVIRLFWLAGGLAVSALLLAATTGGHYAPVVVRSAIAISFGLFLIAFPFQWLFFLREMATWPCPRCAKCFFFSASHSIRFYASVQTLRAASA